MRAHIDPERDDPDKVRIGPTALPTYYLEKKKWSSFIDYLSIMSIRDFPTYIKLLATPKYFSHMIWSLLYKVPGIWPKLYIKNELNYYLPSLTSKDIEFLPWAWWTRPIEADRTKHTLHFGWWETHGINENIKWNKTPSPWASQAMAIWARDALTFANYEAIKLSWITIDKEAMINDWYTLD